MLNVPTFQNMLQVSWITRVDNIRNKDLCRPTIEKRKA